MPRSRSPLKRVGAICSSAEKSSTRDQYPVADRASSDPSASLPAGAIAVQPPAGSTTGSLASSLVSPPTWASCSTTRMPSTKSSAARSTRSTQTRGSLRSVVSVPPACTLQPSGPTSARSTTGGLSPSGTEIVQRALPPSSVASSGSGKMGVASSPSARSCAPNGGWELEVRSRSAGC